MANLDLPTSDKEIIMLNPDNMILIGIVTITSHDFKIHGIGCWIIDDLSNWSTYVKKWKYLEDVFS